MSATPTAETRPTPIRDYLAKFGTYLGIAVGGVSWLGSSGILSVAQTEAIKSYAGELAAATAPTGPISIGIGAVIGLIAGGGATIGIVRAGRGAETATTPVADPRDRDGAVLVRADGLPLGGNPVGQGRTLEEPSGQPNQAVATAPAPNFGEGAR